MIDNRRTANTARITLFITSIAVFSKILGFARDSILAHFYGSSSISDAFITTLSMPDILFELIANSITIGFVPIATGLLDEGRGAREVNRFTSNVVNIFEVLACVFSLIFIVFAEVIIYALAPGFQEKNIDIAIYFLRIISLAMLFKTVSSVLGAYMQTNRNFVPVSMYGVIMDVMIILFIVLSVKKGCTLLPYGVLLGVLAQMIFAVICAVKTGYRNSWTFNLRDPHLKAMLLMFLPAIAATGANQIVQLVNKGMATTVMEGGVTLISNANKMGYAAENIIVLSLAAVIYPILSSYSVRKNIKGFKHELVKGLNCTLILMIPLSIVLIIFSKPIINLLFGHGKYIDSVSYTSQLMKVYCIGIIGLSAYTLMVRALYAQKMVKQSAACAIISLLINIVLCFLLAKTAKMGLMGIALATSLTYTISFVITFLMMYFKIGDIGGSHIVNVILKIAIACIPMAAFSYLTYQLVEKYNSFLALICCAVVGAVTYFCGMYVLKVEEISMILQQIKKKLYTNDDRRNNQ